jgi:hypothetical protein
MTREEIKNTPELVDFILDKCILADSRTKVRKRLEEICDLAIKALEQQPRDDTVSRQVVLNYLKSNVDDFPDYHEAIEKVLQMPPVTQKYGKCKDCRWWKDSDGVYRRGVGAESQCPINCREVYEGNGYCFRFNPQESEE